MTQESLISQDEVFTLLSNRRRRYTLHACKHQTGPVELGPLAKQIAAWEHDKALKEVTSSERQRVYTALQQRHLPAMDDAGVIEFDRSLITLTDSARELDVYMDVVPRNTIPWAEYYFGVSVISVTLLAAAWAGVYPPIVSELVWGVLIAMIFLLSSIVHVWSNKSMRLGTAEKPPELEP